MTRQILVGGIPIGGGAPVVIQSMLNTKTTDVEGSLKQIRQLAAAGCQIARLAVPNKEAAVTFGQIINFIPARYPYIVFVMDFLAAVYIICLIRGAKHKIGE